MLLCHLNWTYAESFVGRECTFQGQHLVITGVKCVNRTTAECFMSCSTFILDSGAAPIAKNRNSQRQGNEGVVVPLVECIHSINLRSLSTLGKGARVAELPLTEDDTARIVQAMVQRLALVHAIPMATKELQKKTPANQLITVVPPPKMHMLFSCTGDAESVLRDVVGRKRSVTSSKLISANLQSKDQIRFPLTDGLRGTSIGKKLFRKKCARHAVHFTRCRCVLPMVATPAHIEALTLALAPVAPNRTSASESIEGSREQNKL